MYICHVVSAVPTAGVAVRSRKPITEWWVGGYDPNKPVEYGFSTGESAAHTVHTYSGIDNLVMCITGYRLLTAHMLMMGIITCNMCISLQK